MNIHNSIHITSGLESKVYLVTANDGSQLILKKRNPRGKQNYLFEAYAYRELLKQGAHVPGVMSANDDELLMSRFSGEAMDDKEDLYGNEKLFAAIASDVALARRITFKGFGVPVFRYGEFAGQWNSWQEYLDTIRGLFDTEQIVASDLQTHELEQLYTYWDSTQPSILLEQGCLVHGDFAMSAIFVNKDKYEGLIDFGDAFIGDPLLDIAYFRFKEITKQYGQKLYERLLKSYAKTSGFAIDISLEKRIIFYMIHWALVRIMYCPDEASRQKFVDKARMLRGMVSKFI